MTTNSRALPEGPRAVVAGHAHVASALIDAVGRISGKADAFRAVSNDGLDAAGVEAAIRQALSAQQARVVFTDLPAGSCTMAARRVARTEPGLAIVTGASVGMLLDFVLGGGDSVADLQRAASRARDAMVVVPPSGEKARGD